MQPVGNFYEIDSKGKSSRDRYVMVDVGLKEDGMKRGSLNDSFAFARGNGLVIGCMILVCLLYGSKWVYSKTEGCRRRVGM